MTPDANRSLLTLLIQERDNIDRAIHVLQGTTRAAGAHTTDTTDTATDTLDNDTGGKRATRKSVVWTPAMREAARRRGKALWARRVKAQGKKG
jgi:hypothetical protein